jgi:hypothetical protein
VHALCGAHWARLGSAPCTALDFVWPHPVKRCLCAVCGATCGEILMRSLCSNARPCYQTQYSHIDVRAEICTCASFTSKNVPAILNVNLHVEHLSYLTNIHQHCMGLCKYVNAFQPTFETLSEHVVLTTLSLHCVMLLRVAKSECHSTDCMCICACMCDCI